MDTSPVSSVPRPHRALGTVVTVLIALIAAGVYLAAAHFWNFWPFSSTPMVACTMEAKMCPDGSAVGRSGPNCEFAPCPGEVTYTNDQYGFSVSLPSGWQGYTVVRGTREIRDIDSGTVVATAPTVSIRHPLSTTSKPRQDIPVDIYTKAQWTGITTEKYAVGAAPIPPSELAHNSTYVFALPARYNYAFPEGFEEVETILAGKPVAAFDLPAWSSSPSGLSGLVLTGPTCPVVRTDDPACDDKPYQGKFNVRAQSGGSVLATFSSDASGHFQITLSPGSYLIEPVVPIGMGKQTQSAVVVPGGMTEVTLTFDTGIR